MHVKEWNGVMICYLFFYQQRILFYVSEGTISGFWFFTLDIYHMGHWH